MASNDALVLSPRGATLDQQRDTIVLVRWALILTCAYLMLLGKDTVGPVWLGPLLVAAFLGSNLVVGRLPRAYFGQQRFKISVALMDVCFIAASLWVAQQLSGELFLLCLGVLVLAIAGLSLGIIAAVTITMSVASLVVAWISGTQLVWQSSVLLRVPFLLGAALVFALLVEGHGSRRRAELAPLTPDELIEGLAAHLAKQNEALRRCSVAMADGTAGTAREALEDAVLHNHQMAQKLARLQPAEARSAA
jgi:hypothetical protein